MPADSPAPLRGATLVHRNSPRNWAGGLAARGRGLARAPASAPVHDPHAAISQRNTTWLMARKSKQYLMNSVSETDWFCP